MTSLRDNIKISNPSPAISFLITSIDFFQCVCEILVSIQLQAMSPDPFRSHKYISHFPRLPLASLLYRTPAGNGERERESEDFTPRQSGGLAQVQEEKAENTARF